MQNFYFIILLLTLPVTVKAIDGVTCIQNLRGGYDCSNGLTLLSPEESREEKARQELEKTKQQPNYKPGVPAGAGGEDKMTVKKQEQANLTKPDIQEEP
ncbi:MAG: hypothetical protein HYV97_06785 [Bdellovibrio sp.]|nr:hypothetical protein [Bdellovibrio sp.]